MMSTVSVESKGLASLSTSLVYQGTVDDCDVENQGLYTVVSTTSNLPTQVDSSYWQYGGMLITIALGSTAYMVQFLASRTATLICSRVKVNSWRAWIQL